MNPVDVIAFCLDHGELGTLLNTLWRESRSSAGEVLVGYGDRTEDGVAVVLSCMDAGIARLLEMRMELMELGRSTFWCGE